MISLMSNLILKKLKLHFWPARAINLMMISIGTFVLMVISSFVSWLDISKISIFPILFMKIQNKIWELCYISQRGPTQMSIMNRDFVSDISGLCISYDKIDMIPALQL
jgi:hypothetical protein